MYGGCGISMEDHVYWRLGLSSFKPCIKDPFSGVFGPRLKAKCRFDRLKKDHSFMLPLRKEASFIPSSFCWLLKKPPFPPQSMHTLGSWLKFHMMKQQRFLPHTNAPVCNGGRLMLLAGPL
ncbi:hypothetical protein VNO77_27600 [Canavalia gladiata]|uniref:Uncharacterized protein n=1 Tax=Canavalia gladiata TaxID=3824 RepID=A0AAN9Q6M6_CANGL